MFICPSCASCVFSVDGVVFFVVADPVSASAAAASVVSLEAPVESPFDARLRKFVEWASEKKRRVSEAPKESGTFVEEATNGKWPGSLSPPTSPVDRYSADSS